MTGIRKREPQRATPTEPRARLGVGRTTDVRVAKEFSSIFGATADYTISHSRARSSRQPRVLGGGREVRAGRSGAGSPRGSRRTSELKCVRRRANRAYAPPSLHQRPLLHHAAQCTRPTRPHTQLSTAAVAPAPTSSVPSRAATNITLRPLLLPPYHACPPMSPAGSFARRAPMPPQVKLPHTQPSASHSRRCPHPRSAFLRMVGRGRGTRCAPGAPPLSLAHA